MVYIKPWNKESERILKNLTRIGKAWTHDKQIGPKFGMKGETLDPFIDVAWINSRRKERQTLIVTKENVVVVPKKGKFEFYKIL